MSYRDAAYGSYVGAHLDHLQQLSHANLERQRPVYRARFLNYLPPDRSAPILDLGCGHGSFLYFLRAEGFETVEGVDVSPEQVKMARDFNIENVVNADLMKFLHDCPDERYEANCMLDVIEHFKKQELLPLLQQTHRCLRRGGRLILYTPNAEGPFGARYRYYDLTHEIGFTPQSMAQAIRLAGFSSVMLRPVEPVVHGLASAFRWVLWKAIKIVLRFYMLVETGTCHGFLFTQSMITIAMK